MSEPTTEAERLRRRFHDDPLMLDSIRAIEAEARADALREDGLYHAAEAAPLDVDAIAEKVKALDPTFSGGYGAALSDVLDILAATSREDGSEYGRLLAERDRLIADGADPADLELPLPPTSRSDD